MLKIRPLPSLEYLKECFVLDFTCPSGLRWKERPRHHFDSEKSWKNQNTRYKGKPAGKIRKEYYRVGLGNGSEFPVHRIIYSISNNVTLSTNFVVDHINRNGFDNHPTNLRLLSAGENLINRKLSILNTSGFTNVKKIENKRGTVWELKIENYKKRFPTFEEAVLEAKKHSIEKHGELSPYYLEFNPHKVRFIPEKQPDNYVYFRDYLLY